MTKITVTAIGCLLVWTGSVAGVQDTEPLYRVGRGGLYRVVDDGDDVRLASRVALPKKSVHVDPVYPADARRQRLEGVVVLQGVIGTDGTLDGLTVLRSVPELDDAALAAARGWEYDLVMLDDRPIRLQFVFTVNFKVD
jgi:TonB family protein